MKASLHTLDNSNLVGFLCIHVIASAINYCMHMLQYCDLYCRNIDAMKALFLSLQIM